MVSSIMHWGDVKNHKRPEVCLSSLQANRLAASFTDAGRRYATRGSEVKSFIIYNTASRANVRATQVLLALWLPWGPHRWAWAGAAHTVGLHQGWGAPSSGKQNVFFWTASKFAAFALEWDTIFILFSSKETSFVLHKGDTSLQGCWKKRLQQNC